jgi:hypothetical protein
MDCKDTALECDLLLHLEKLKKKKEERIVGHFDNESKITEKKLLISTRTLEDIAIKYLRWILIVARKATISVVMSVC